MPTLLRGSNEDAVTVDPSSSPQRIANAVYKSRISFLGTRWNTSSSTRCIIIVYFIILLLIILLDLRTASDLKGKGREEPTVVDGFKPVDHTNYDLMFSFAEKFKHTGTLTTAYQYLQKCEQGCWIRKGRCVCTSNSLLSREVGKIEVSTNEVSNNMSQPLPEEIGSTVYSSWGVVSIFYPKTLETYFQLTRWN